VTTHRWAERANPPSLRPCTSCWPPTKAVTSPVRGWRSPAADPCCERWRLSPQGQGQDRAVGPRARPAGEAHAAQCRSGGAVTAHTVNSPAGAGAIGRATSSVSMAPSGDPQCQNQGRSRPPAVTPRETNVDRIPARTDGDDTPEPPRG